MSREGYRNKALAAGVALLGGIAGYELSKQSPSQPSTRKPDIGQSVVSDFSQVNQERKLSHAPESPPVNELAQPLVEGFESDFTKMDFQKSDILDLSRVYEAEPGDAEKNSDRYAYHDQSLRLSHEADPILKAEYDDIASHLTIEVESDWLKFTTTDEYGGIDLAYQIVQPTSEHSSWGISEDDSSGGGYSIDYYSAPSGIDTVGDLKERILMAVKSKIEYEAGRYRQDK